MVKYLFRGFHRIKFDSFSWAPVKLQFLQPGEQAVFSKCCKNAGCLPAVLLPITSFLLGNPTLRETLQLILSFIATSPVFYVHTSCALQNSFTKHAYVAVFCHYLN